MTQSLSDVLTDPPVIYGPLTNLLIDTLTDPTIYKLLTDLLIDAYSGSLLYITQHITHALCQPDPPSDMMTKGNLEEYIKTRIG
jgi:hypothetical protein